MEENQEHLFRKPGFKEEGLAPRARCSEESRRMRPEKRLLDLKIMKFYMTFPEQFP